MLSRWLICGSDFSNIIFHGDPLTYHKKPSAVATAYDIVIGTIEAIRLTRRTGAKIIHARFYVAASIGLAVKAATGAKLLFDMRGFWADEKVDGNLWPAGGWLYRGAKQMERRLLLAADHVVVLTNASKRELLGFDYLIDNMPKITVIPTCADLEQFKVINFDKGHPFTFGYVGSIGTWYLFDEALAFFQVLRRRRPDARLLIVNRGQHSAIRQVVLDAGISEDEICLWTAAHSEVPALINQMHAAAAIIKPCYSKIASAATKVAEYMGCGVPCVGNVGVGDMEEVIENNRVGVILKDFSEREMERAADKLFLLISDPETPQRCAETARKLFALEDGVFLYELIYKELAFGAESLPARSQET